MFFNYAINLLLLSKSPFNKFINTIISFKIITGKVNLSPIHTNFAPIKLEKMFLIFYCVSTFIRISCF